MKKIIILLMLLCLFLVSCEGKTEIGKSDITESETQAGTESETESVDLNKEIAENYTNNVVALEKVQLLENMFQNSDNGNGLTYYEIVKILESTGKNTSDIMYRYEWQVDDGRYYRVKFEEVTINNGKPLVYRIGSGNGLFDYSLDSEIISQKYKYWSEYLFDSYYKNEFSSYSSFLDWFGYRNIPEIEEYTFVNPTEQDIQRVVYGYANLPVDKKQLLNIKEGMTVYEVMDRLKSSGEFSASMIHITWKAEKEDFYMRVGTTYSPKGKAFGTVFNIQYFTEEELKRN